MRLGLALIAIACLLSPHGVGRDGTIIIKFSHVSAPQAHKSRAAEHFKKLAEEYTGGKVRIELYPNSQLYKDKEELEALQLGAVQMLAPSVSKLAPLGVKEFEVFDLPYLFSGYDALRKVTDGPIGKELLAKLEAKGILGLAFWDNGFKILSANKPLISPDDLLGLKMRVEPRVQVNFVVHAPASELHARRIEIGEQRHADGEVGGRLVCAETSRGWKREAFRVGVRRP